MKDIDDLQAPPFIKKDLVALRIWKDTVPLLGDSVNNLDIAVLINFCQSYATALRMEYYLRYEGRTVVAGKLGFIQARPEVDLARQSWKEVRTCADRIGLNPIARKKLKIVTGNKGDDFEDLTE